MDFTKNTDPVLCTPATVYPEHVATMDDTLEFIDALVPKNHPKAKKFKRIIRNTRVEKRHFVRPLQDTLKKCGLKERQEVFEREAPKLAISAAQKALANACAHPVDIGMVLAVCATAPARMMPGLDQCVIEGLDLPRGCLSLSVAQWGCRGGGAALRMAREWARANPKSAALVVFVETCSLLYQEADMENEEVLQSAVICHAIFGDAAAACVIAGAESPLLGRPWAGDVRMELGEGGTHQLPKSLNYMRYETSDNGMHFRMTREVPESIHRVAPLVVNSCPKGSLNGAALLLHAGGPRILQHFMEAIADMEGVPLLDNGANDPRCGYALETLRNFGNIASISVINTIRARMEDGGEQPCLVVGIGPGTGADWLLCRLKKHEAVSHLSFAASQLRLSITRSC